MRVKPRGNLNWSLLLPILVSILKTRSLSMGMVMIQVEVVLAKVEILDVKGPKG